MATLGEYPNVRWWDGSKCEVQGRGVGRVLADMVQAELDDLCRLDSDFPPQSPFPRATLIIVDRTIDTVAPLLHEFTYQAMINDLLPIEEGTKYNYTTAEGQNVSVSLDDSDPLWKTIRHSHIAETINITIERFNAFMSGNAAAKSALGAAGQGSAASLKDMKATLAALPQFQELKTKFAAHINLCQECMGLFERGKLASVGGVEQDMATGKTVEGDAPKNVVVNMVPLLDDPSIRWVRRFGFGVGDLVLGLLGRMWGVGMPVADFVRRSFTFLLGHPNSPFTDLSRMPIFPLPN